jgi:hypothetical protein
VYEKKRVKTTKTDWAAKSLIRLRVKQKKRTSLLNVGALLCQKATSKREKRPATPHAIKTKIKLVELIIRSIEKTKRPSRIENRPSSGSFLKYT